MSQSIQLVCVIVVGYTVLYNINEKLGQFFQSQVNCFLFFMADMFGDNCASFSAFARNFPVLSLCSTKKTFFLEKGFSVLSSLL